MTLPIDKQKLLELADCDARLIGDGYAVTADGNVWSSRKGEWRKLSPSVNEGYRHVSIKRGDRFITAKAARLVCEAFHGPKPEGAQLVRHLDGTRDNDTPGNLKWGTVSQNAYDAVRHGTSPSAANARKSAPKRSGDKSHYAKLDWDTVRQVRLLRSQGTAIAALGDRFGIDQSTISLICSGRTWKELGMIVTKGVRIDG
jgi:hypothetical protein